MKCPNCGKEMKELGKLTDNEYLEMEFFNYKERSANDALRSDILNVSELTPEQTFEYFHAAFTLKAEAEFLKFCFYKKLREKYKVSPKEDIIIGNDSVIYLH